MEKARFGSTLCSPTFSVQRSVSFLTTYILLLTAARAEPLPYIFAAYALAAFKVLFISIVIVITPTPPGTGVM